MPACDSVLWSLPIAIGVSRRKRGFIADFDVLVIGGSNAGKRLHSNREGRQAPALVYNGDVGGLRALRGCNPKQVLVCATEVLDEARSALGR